MGKKQYLKHYGWMIEFSRGDLTKPQNPKQDKEKRNIYWDVSLWKYEKLTTSEKCLQQLEKKERFIFKRSTIKFLKGKNENQRKMGIHF